MNSGRAMPIHSAAATDGAYEPVSLSQLTRDMARMNDEAWREFHQRYFHRLYHYALKLHRGDHASAEDSVQSGFLRAVRNIKRFDDEEVFWSWLTLLVRCAAADQGRSVTARNRMLEALASSCTPTSSKTINTNDTAFVFEEVGVQEDARASSKTINTNDTAFVLLEEALLHLSVTDRKLLDEKYTRGSTNKELAEAHETTAKAIECRLRRIRKQLKSKIHALSKHITA